MNIAVRYFTRSGNTKKLAEAVAKVAFAEAMEVSSPLTEKADILFLACSYYAFDIDPEVKRFILENKSNIGKIVCVGTSAMMKSIKRPVRRVASKAGITVADEEFHCRGQFKKAHPGRPNENDLSMAADFVKSLIPQKL
ncbi:MAG: flavodoxin [Oscillospiraceae bacterium]|nr:flavodoxin [Oscillospiraceae bacterium]